MCFVVVFFVVVWGKIWGSKRDHGRTGSLCLGFSLKNVGHGPHPRPKQKVVSSKHVVPEKRSGIRSAHRSVWPGSRDTPWTQHPPGPGKSCVFESLCPEIDLMSDLLTVPFGREVGICHGHNFRRDRAKVASERLRRCFAEFTGVLATPSFTDTTPLRRGHNFRRGGPWLCFAVKQTNVRQPYIYIYIYIYFCWTG